MFRWASLGDRPYERFPAFDDPYEPMVQVLELGGEFLPGQGGIELPIAGVAYRSLDFRLSQEPIAIDAATLAALDERDRAELEKVRARAAQRAQEAGIRSREGSGSPDGTAGGPR